MPSGGKGMSFEKRAAIGLVAIAVVTAACGGGGSKKTHLAKAASHSDSTTTTSTVAGAGNAASAAAQAANIPNAANGSASKPGVAAAPGAGATTTTQPLPHLGNLPVQVSWAQPCIKPGTAQTITVKVGTKERTAVGYNTVYSDGNNSRQASDFKYCLAVLSVITAGPRM